MNVSSNHRKHLVAVGAVAASLAMASCASTVAPSQTSSAAAQAAPATVATTPADISNAYDITKLCGDKPMNIAFAKGTGNTDSQLVMGELMAEASKCPNVKVRFVDAQGSQQKAISDINALVAQGIDGIITQPEFGEAQLPSMRAAVKAGVPVVTLISDPGGTIGTDMTDKVHQDFPALGQKWADWMNTNVKAGKVVFLGGTPGAPSSKSFFDGLTAGLTKYPDLKLVQDSIVNTNWDAAEKKRVTAGLLAQHGRIDAVVSDYGWTDLGALDAYKDAGMKLPALVTVASANGDGCRWQQDEFPYLSIEGTTTLSRIALRKVIAAANKVEDPESSTVQLPAAIDTAGGKDPKCDKSLPLDANLSADLTSEQLKAIFK